MIEIQVKIHDKFSVEMKIGFAVKPDALINDFAVNTWFFIPNSLDINTHTYSKSQFYRDVKSNVRLITPVFPLGEIADGQALPLKNIRQAFENIAAGPSHTGISEYEYQIKMFMAIFKSSMRDEILRVADMPLDGDVEELCRNYIASVGRITRSYRSLREIINLPAVEPEVLNYFLFGDEFMSSIVLRNTFKLLRNLERRDCGKCAELAGDLARLAAAETTYAGDMGYPVVDVKSPNNNRNVIFRNGVLKKYIESDLFLSTKQQEDGKFIKQTFYSIAAGIAMIFATAVAFWGQRKYGQLTPMLFVALVISYMFKDRIKETMRFYFVHKLKDKYFDKKTTISIKDKVIGWIKEGVDFISEDNVPSEVTEMRSRTPLLQAENRINDEKILLYRKMVRIDGNALSSEDKYSLTGINNIVRLHLTGFVQKMDNPQAPLYTIDDDNKIGMVYGDKIYYLNFITQLQYDGKLEYKRFRLVFNRSGILDIEEIE